MRADDFESLSRLVRADAGVALERGDTYAIERRLERLAAVSHHRDVHALLAAAHDAAADLRRQICEAVTVHETRFFRDERVFTALADRVIPGLVAAGRRSISVWCAAAASGQEVASIAILMRERFPGIAATILATDLSRAMVERTRSAVYSDFEAGRGLSEEQRARHFVSVPAGFQLRTERLAAIEAQQLNLAAPWPRHPPFDLILMRNVLVYLDAAVRSDILVRAHAALAPDGVLVLGATERCSVDLFTRFTVAAAVFYRSIQEPR